ncbi:hypothetical protein G7070_04275 [Propioniciclava coleopterorum]|uniref:Solute-binding protein family 5 domain-containing protein n=1 Tax=Propioniciclava coleopterorum TaxID=2714937 RepID=A0A6G7Y4J3_9ACTN|nr:ABC transporter substrate-binding protein [Propioniciclava coleopterorum]QIK71629.1 hypothetical protein G7070_04275 [Propioniciclava coleopterorum]
MLAPLTPAHFSLDAAGRARPNPDFVTSFEVESTPATRVTLHLNPLSRWGDGARVTAADWVATWRAATGQVAGLELVDLPGWQRVADVSAGETPTDVVLTYHGPDPDWAEPLVSGPLRGDGIGDAAAADWDAYDPAHYAAPFTVAHVDPVQGLITLEPSPTWWGDAAKLEQVMFRTVQPEAVAAAFQHNELDVWTIGTSEDRLQQSKAAADTVLRTAPGRKGRSLRLTTEGTLADVKVRQAVVQALDRGALGATELDVTPGTVTPWSNSLLLPTQPGYVDEARATGLSHDAAQAATTLEEAGWRKDPDGHRSKEGRPLALTYGVTETDALAGTEFTALSAQLAAVGISLSAVPGTGDLTPTTITVGAFPLAQLPASANRPELAELVTKVRTEQDGVRRADQAGQLARALWQDATEVTLFQLPQQVAVRNGLANYGAPAFSTTDWEDVGWAT